jgi:CRISPR type III-A-associated protein Csm2
VKGGIDREFVEAALEFARAVGPGLAVSQVRSIFGEVARQELQGLDPARLLLLKPRLAYLAARAQRSEMRDLRAVLERGLEAVCAEGIDAAEQRVRFERFSEGFQAILAYQRVQERKQGERP